MRPSSGPRKALRKADLPGPAEDNADPFASPLSVRLLPFLLKMPASDF